MRNGLLAALALLLLLAPRATAEPPCFLAGLDNPAQTPSDDDPRPNIAPRGYPIYGRADYLLWWTEKDRALLPSATDFGALEHMGERMVVGYWLDPQQTYAFEIGEFWMIERTPTDGAVVGDGAYHNEFDNRFWSIEAQLRGEVYRCRWAHVDLLGGFRFLELDERLQLAERNDSAISEERFTTRNHFFGGQIGTEVELHHAKWFVDIWGKVALGATCEEFRATPTTAVPHGDVDRSPFAVLPELGVNFGYQISSSIRVTAGYTFFYLSDAARPGLSPGRGSDYWGQGLNLGFEFRY